MQEKARDHLVVTRFFLQDVVADSHRFLSCCATLIMSADGANRNVPSRIGLLRGRIGAVLVHRRIRPHVCLVQDL